MKHRPEDLARNLQQRERTRAQRYRLTLRAVPEGGTVTAYSTRHWRVREQRGPAKLLKCVHCAVNGIDKQARDWACLHDRDGEDPQDYVPLCRKCHIAYDGSGHHVPHTEEAKAVLSEKNRTYRHTPEAVEKIRAASAGRKHTPESITKMSAQQKAAAAMRGPMPEEQRAKISASLRKNGGGESAPDARVPKGAGGRPVGNPNLGKTRAAQQRAKTHCDQNHELTPDNIYWRGPDKKNRQCKRCARERSAARYQAQKEAARRKAA